jgi:hypothetical protein
MDETPSFNDILTAYEQIPETIASALARIPVDKFDTLRGGSEMSLRETVHHIVEANIVAASMTIAALGSEKATYDWSWLWPGRDWCDRMRYDAVPLDAAITTLNGLIQHIVNMVHVRDDAATRKVSVHDTPGATPYFLTVAQILHQEAKHADEHLGEIATALENT